MDKRYAFLGYLLDAERGSLERGGCEIRLRPQSFRVLQYLVERHGRLVTKTELMDAVWGDTAVTEDSLVQCLRDVRRALDDSAQRLVETVPRRGYRFTPPVVSAITSLAVLPFADLSPDGDRGAYFAEGLTEELIDALARVPGLRVAPRSSSFRYRDAASELARVRDDLKVGGAIEGSVRSAGGRLRVTARLVDVADASILWSESYDRPVGDVFAIQDEICRAIVARVRSGTPASADRPLVRRYTENIEAYRMYLTGRYFWNRRSREGFEKAIEAWRRAIALDPGYPLPHVGLGDAHVLLGYFAYADPHDAFEAVADAAGRALAIDPDLAGAHVALANRELHYAWDLPGAERAVRRALAADESDAYARHIVSHVAIAAGDLARSLAFSEQALAMAPVEVAFLGHLGWHHYHAREYERGIEACRRALDLEPTFVQARTYLVWLSCLAEQWDDAVAEVDRVLAHGGSPDAEGWRAIALARSGRRDEARAVLAGLTAASPGRYVSPYRLATVHLALGDREEAWRLLERAVVERATALAYVRTDPALDELRGETRFDALVRAVWADDSAGAIRDSRA